MDNFDTDITERDMLAYDPDDIMTELERLDFGRLLMMAKYVSEHNIFKDVCRIWARELYDAVEVLEKVAQMGGRLADDDDWSVD